MRNNLLGTWMVTYHVVNKAMLPRSAPLSLGEGARARASQCSLQATRQHRQHHRAD